MNDVVSHVFAYSIPTRTKGGAHDQSKHFTEGVGLTDLTARYLCDMAGMYPKA